MPFQAKASLEMQERQKGRVRAPVFFSLLMENILSIASKMSLLLFPPCSLLLWAFFFIAEDSNPGRLEVSPSCGKSGDSYQIMLQLSHDKSTESENIYSTPPCHRSRGTGIQPVGRGHSSLPQWDSPATPSIGKGWACWYGSLGPRLWLCSLLFVAKAVSFIMYSSGAIYSLWDHISTWAWNLFVPDCKNYQVLLFVWTR